MSRNNLETYESTAASSAEVTVPVTGTQDGDKRRLDVSAKVENPSGGTAATGLVVHNVSMPSAATEYSQALSATTVGLEIKCRGNATLQVTLVSGESGTTFFTVSRGATLSLLNLNLTSATIYLQSNLASQIAEIFEYVG